MDLHQCYDIFIPKKKPGEPYKCPDCPKECNAVWEIRYHINTQHRNKTYDCSRCEFKAKTNSLLSSHIARRHDKKKDHLCPECGKRFGLAYTLKKHIEKVHLKLEEKKVAQKFQCDKCDEAFDLKIVLIKHLAHVHDVHQEKSFVCQHCNRAFNGKECLKDHEIQNHPSQEILDSVACSCDVCEIKYDTPETLDDHMKVVHDGQRQRTCDRCPTTWHSHLSLKKHFAVTHRLLLHPCPECDKVMKLKGVLAQHMQEQHDNKKVFPCEHCGKSFTRRYCLKEHIARIHEDGGSFKCDSCDFKATTKRKLEIHSQAAHVREVSYSCGKCSFVTFRKQCLNSHILQVHEKRKRHICPECGVGFWAKRDKIKHMEKHA